jgi:diguanylate cyclase (GGDEF)-like protein
MIYGNINNCTVQNMKKFEFTDYFLVARWDGWRLWAAWSVCILAVILLGTFRRETDADFTLASLVLFPVLFISWMGGVGQGLVMSMLAVMAWAIGDFSLDRRFSASWIPWANAVTHILTYSLVAILSAQVKQQFEKERAYATRDVLTGLKNRRAFLGAGATEVERSKRYKHSLAVIFLDLDNFKQLNDSLGHDAGDAALQACASALLETLRHSDRVARLGGDEFAVLLPEIGYDDAVEAGHKISVALSNALCGFPPVTGSIGVAWFETVDRPFPSMLKAADELMYAVKASGKGSFRAQRFDARNNALE